MDSAVEAARDAFLAVFEDARAARERTFVADVAGEYADRVEASLRAVQMLIEAVGADEEHPVGHAIHRKLGRAFTLGSTIPMAWHKAQRDAAWLRSQKFEETVELWESLRSCPANTRVQS